MRYLNQIRPHFKKIVVFLAAVLLAAAVTIFRHPSFLLRESSLADFAFFSKDGLRAIYNVLSMCILIGIWLGILWYAVCRILWCIRHRDELKTSFERNYRRILIVCGIIAALLAVSALSELLCSRIFDGTVNSLGIYFNPYRFFLISGVVITGFLFFLYYHKVIRRIEQLFLLAALVVGLVFVISMPITTNVSWDDQIHYKNTSATSFPATKYFTGADYAMFTLQFPITYDMSEIGEQIQTLEAANHTIASISDEKYIPFYQAIAYVPAATGLMISRVLHLPFLFSFLLGRYLNLITYAVIVSYALRQLKWGKSILLVIALFPTNLFLATNYSYDYFVTALSLLGFACLFGEFQRRRERMTIKSTILIFGSLILAFGPKAIYFPMILLALFLPKEKFADEKQYKQFRILTIAATCFMIAVFALPFLFTGAGGDDIRGGSDVNSIEQIKYILFHPIVYTKTLLGFLFGSYLRLDNSSFYTNFMAYLGSGCHAVFSMILLTMASLFDRRVEEGRILKLPLRLAAYVLSFITICLIATALYISFTPVGSELILGCSPRYLAPLIFPVVYCCGLSRFNHKYSRRMINFFITGFSLFILYHTIWTQCISLYV